MVWTIELIDGEVRITDPQMTIRWQGTQTAAVRRFALAIASAEAGARTVEDLIEVVASSPESLAPELADCLRKLRLEILPRFRQLAEL